ncbi:MAG: M12 family metallo-peptidase, partial [Nonlabens ulvanivorans]
NAANKKLFNYIDSDTLSSKQKERIKKLSNKSHHQKIIKLEESAFRNSTSSFDIELLDIGLLTFSDIKSRKNNLGHTIINSKSLDSSTDRLTLTSTPDGTFVGILFAGGKIYDILPISDDIYSLTENNEVNLPEEPILEDLSDEASTSYDDSVFESTYDSNNYITSSSSLAASNVIDIAVVYTDNALDELGSESAIEAQIMLMHDQINTIMENNGVDSAVAAQLVYVGPTSYEQSANDIFTYLDDLKDGTVPETDDLRNAYGADIVAMIVSDGGYCGVATLTASANQAFMVVKTFCTNYTFAHELGHLIGMNHNYEESPSNNYYHGYLLEGVHRTVLSYNSENTSTPRIPYWSSDDQSVDGYSIGNATLADNERRLLARDTTVSNFRTTAEFDNDPTASISSNV